VTPSARRLVVLAAASAVAACAPGWKSKPHDQLFQYDAPRAAKRPTPGDPSDWWDRTDLVLVRPLGRMLSPGTYAMSAFGPPSAEDVNRLGQVPDSTWFENRIGRRDFTSDEAAAGAAKDAVLAPGPLAVISGKIDGVSAGFVVRDTADQIWYLKLDHPAFPELSTGAEVISSRLLWLAGYHVPTMLVVDVEPSRFVLDPDAKTKDGYNRSVPLTQQALDQLLANTNPDATGKVRVLISLQPPGEILGSFSYQGTRDDDANDTIDHENRRSLRALWLFSAWINNTDTRDANTLDMFRQTNADGRGIVEHYLIDFGDSFGASGLGEKTASEGWEYLLDWPSVFVNLFSLGVRIPEYTAAKRSAFRSIGLFEADVFDASEWKPFRPNPAFDRRTSGDIFWAASILARIQPEHVTAAVGAGRYREAGAASAIVAILLERRRKLIEYGLAHFLELDRPRVKAGQTLVLDDLRVLGGLPPLAAVQYSVRWDRTRGFDRDLAKGEATADADTKTVVIDLGPAIAAAKRTNVDGDPFLTVSLTRNLGASMEVHLRLLGDRVVPIGVSR
jgi:hypothetical protein